MNKREGYLLALATLLGLAGGFASSTLSRAKEGAPEIIRATRFELTDLSGRTVAFFGLDGHGGTVIAFTGRDTRQLAVLGLTVDQYPFLRLFGSDGKARAVLQLEADSKPVLVMSDDNYEGRVILGPIRGDFPDPNQDSWGLLLRAPGPTEAASVAMVREHPGGATFGAISVRTPKGTWSVR